MVKKKVLVITDSMPWGHRSIAKAIYAYLATKKDLKVNYAQVDLGNSLGNDVYAFMYRFAPILNRLPHKLSENKRIISLVNREMETRGMTKFSKVIEKYEPDLVISTYLFNSRVLLALRRRQGFRFKLWTVVADPRTVNPLSFLAEADLNLVYDEKVFDQARKWGVKDKNLLVTGWWTRPEMFFEYDRKKERQRLGIKDDRPVIFIGGGSLGTNSLTRLLPVLLLIKRPVAVIVNTGTDKLAYKMVENYKKYIFSLRKKQKDLVIFKNMGWIEEMGRVLSAVDIVFGKAGPNFLFDVVAAGKPFVAITHIGGQEDGNIDLIREKKLGWVKEKTGEAVRLVLAYLDDPDRFSAKYKKSIEAEGKRNKKSLEIIYKKILSESGL